MSQEKLLFLASLNKYAVMNNLYVLAEVAGVEAFEETARFPSLYKEALLFLAAVLFSSGERL